MIELVKNSYDADASYVAIKFTPPLEQGRGRITVTDDGHGMTLADIQDKWMEPATTAKISGRRSPVRKRHMMGSKGIGRFAAAKLGEKMALNSISNRDGERQEVLIPEIDWSQFNGETYLSDVSIEYFLQESDAPTGTTIEITNLSETWSESKISRLFFELRRLISPIDRNEEDRFSIYLDLSDCTHKTTGFDGSALMGAQRAPNRVGGQRLPGEDYEVLPFPLLGTSDYEVEGIFDEAGHFHGSIEIRRGGQAPRPVRLALPLLEDEQACGMVSVRLSLFDREAASVREIVRKAGMGEVSAAEARRILDSIAGIAIYRAGFRVRPYGDSENDWLVLDKRRVQNPTLRIGHNQVAGYISVEEQDQSGLIERSSREGFEQNGSFRRLQRLITELLAQCVEPQRQKFREDAGLSRRKEASFDEIRKISGLEALQELVPQMPRDKQESAQSLIAKESALLVEKFEALEERQRILEAQSSLGQIIGEILHEGAPRASFIAKTGHRLKQRYQHLFNNSSLTEETKREFPERLALLSDTAEALRKLFESLRPLSGARRGPPVDFYGVDLAHDVLGIFSGHHVSTSVHVQGERRRLLGYPEDLNTALVNLVGNSLHWLEQSKTPNPTVDIRFSWQGDEAIIFVDDNGPGIPEEFAEQIFHVGFTLKNGGTGLGLNISKEALSRSGATLLYHRDFEPGTRFEIRFPAVGA